MQSETQFKKTIINMGINLAYIQDLSDGDNSIINEMIDIFFEQIEEYRDQMQKAIDDKEWMHLSKLAHKAKSSVAVFGMEETTLLMKTLEKLASTAEKTETYQAIFDQFISDCIQAKAELSIYIMQKNTGKG